MASRIFPRVFPARREAPRMNQSTLVFQDSQLERRFIISQYAPYIKCMRENPAKQWANIFFLFYGLSAIIMFGINEVDSAITWATLTLFYAIETCANLCIALLKNGDAYRSCILISWVYAATSAITHSLICLSVFLTKDTQLKVFLAAVFVQYLGHQLIQWQAPQQFMRAVFHFPLRAWCAMCYGGLMAASDDLSLGVRIVACIYMSCLLFFSKSTLERSERSSFWTKQQLFITKKKVADIQSKLNEAQQLITAVMEESADILRAYELTYDDIDFGGSTKTILGEGSYGTVYKATLNDTIDAAVKTMRVGKINKEALKRFKGELIIMCPLHHPNIVRLLGGVWNEGADKLCIVLEYCPSGTLKNFFLPEENDVGSCGVSNEKMAHRYNFSLGIAKCLSYLHHDLKEPLIHRDIKPDNVLVGQRFEAKVADFGESTHFDRKTVCRSSDESDNDAASMSMVGSRYYCAPEILMMKRYNEKVDVFSFALVLLSLIIGDINYVKTSADRSRVRPDIAYSSGWRPQIPAKLHEASPQLVKLVEGMWQSDFNRRPQMRVVVAELQNLGSMPIIKYRKNSCNDPIGKVVKIEKKTINLPEFRSFELAGAKKTAVPVSSSMTLMNNRTDKMTNKTIDSYLRNERMMNQDKLEVLMLGAANVGKSTILKQLRLMHSTAFSAESERHPFTKILRQNFVDAVNALAVERLDTAAVIKDEEREIFLALRLKFLNARASSAYPNCADLLDAALALWQHPVVVREYERCCAEVCFPIANMKHLARRSIELCSANFCPTILDVLCSRRQTTLDHAELQVKTSGCDEFTMKITDPGGQRTLRRKWITLFDGVHAVIFVASLAAYNEFPPDACGKNGLRESIVLFKEIIETPSLSEASIILFLNKDDIFRDKIKVHSVGDYFTTAPQGNQGRNYDRALKFIKARFLKAARGHTNRLNILVTNATDRNQASYVLKKAVRNALKYKFAAVTGEM